MTKIIEYSVRPVVRYIIARYEHEDLGSGRSIAGSEGFGEHDHLETAFRVAQMLAKAEPGAELFDHTGERPAGSKPARIPVPLDEPYPISPPHRSQVPPPG